VERFCVVGAGPAGLSAARALKRLRIPYDQFERHSDVGGIGDLDNPGTPMYESAHFISSRKLSGFFDFPMPDDNPDYPDNRQILGYGSRHPYRAVVCATGVTWQPRTPVHPGTSGPT
jgi:cation diffusion facilitator CzcD-associated flavoprotein CzcO